jgi:mRNA degradation ribonuclease J1/J2
MTPGSDELWFLPLAHIQMADPAFIAERRDALAALIVTRAHEDHVGAVAHLWRPARCSTPATGSWTTIRWWDPSIQ